MPFLRVNVTFYEAVNMINDVIRTASLFPYTVKFMFDGVRNKKSHYNKTHYLTRFGQMRIISPRLKIYQFSQP